MNDSYTMIPVKSSTRNTLKQELEKLTVERKGKRTTYDDLLNELLKK